MQYHAMAQLYSQDYCILFKIISFYNSIHFIFFLLNLFFLLIDIIVANNYCTNNYCIIVPYHYRSQFPDFITFLQNKDSWFKQRLHIEDTARLGQAMARWVFFQGRISQAKESCEPFMGDSIEKSLPMEKWERVMRGNVQDFPLDIRGLAKVVAPLISYCLWTSFLTLSNTVST